MDSYSIVRPAPRTLSAFKEFFEQMASESISSCVAQHPLVLHRANAPPAQTATTLMAKAPA
jgi:hypothetical protein